MSVYHVLEVYLLLLTDSFVASLILPLSKSTAFSIMCYFGSYSSALSVVIASLGASIGGGVNWFLGRLVSLARIEYHNRSNHIVGTTTKTGGSFAYMLLIPLLAALSWVNLVGAIINVLCGYFRVRIIYVFFSVLLSYLVHFVIIAGRCSS